MRSANRSILVLILCLVGLLSLPLTLSEGLRGRAISLFSPVWETLFSSKQFLEAPFERIGSGDHTDIVATKDQEIKRLLLENQQLGNEIAHLKELFEQEYMILHQMMDDDQIKALPQNSKKLFSRHQQEMSALFHIQLMNLPARIIYRPVNAWSNVVWVDVGNADNQRLGRVAIAKNSPVVIGIAVVGVVDYVGERQSRIRLITDSGLNPSVRIKRGTKLLAKGTLCGECEPRMRFFRQRLKGIGFNYDFPDTEGPARDLRTGEVLDRSLHLPPLPLVQLNDLLITTGMDGVYPPGLQIGIVKKITPLKEGDDEYSLEAEPLAGDLNRLSLVFILPPRGYNLEDQPLF